MTSAFQPEAPSCDRGPACDLCGQHTHGHVDGAVPNGTRMRKIHSRGDDAHRDGAPCTVIGSGMAESRSGVVTIGYFVTWDDRPGIACFVVSKRLEPAEGN